MSRFSGKCDVYDSLVEIHEYTDKELRDNVNIYFVGSDKPLHINSVRDLIPYYPHIISSAGFNNVDRTATIYISKDSYVDCSERRILESCLHDFTKIYNRCKRKKMDFAVNDAIKEVSWNNWNIEALTELANRVKERGKKATINGIHLIAHEQYRQELVDVMLKNGLNPADYGYGRFIKEK